VQSSDSDDSARNRLLNSSGLGPAGHIEKAPQVRSVHRWPAEPGSPGSWPSWISAEVVAAFAQRGIVAPWSHQVAAAEAAYAGSHVVLATGTASGKSLGYLLPVLAATHASPTHASQTPDGPTRAPVRPRATPGPASLMAEALLHPTRPHTALYLAPTKALAHDQLRACTELGLPSWRVATLDGDTEPAARDWVREHAAYILSNPDMLHRSVLPNHARWAPVLRALRYVVVDEAHRYRGVFGAQVAAVIGRLRRLARHYGAEPVFVLASATSSNAREAAARLIGVAEGEIVVVDRNDSARAARELVLWQPETDTDEDAAQLLAELVATGRQTLAFAGSRRAAERMAMRARELAPKWPIEAYRGGYLAQDRRRIEAELQSGYLRGVASTNALELGVDIAGMDAVVIAGYPGTRAAFWQQSGRAGRAGRDALTVLVARFHPLDGYLIDHPETLVEAPVEATVLHPQNPYVLGPQLAAAAQELPLTSADTEFFGAGVPALAQLLERRGILRRRPNGWYWTGIHRAVDAINLRSAGGSSIEIIEAVTGRVLGSVDPITADTTVHPGAVYLHQGETYLCEELNAEDGEALVRAARPGYLTQPRRRTGVQVIAERRTIPQGAGELHSGQVEVHSQVTGYLRRDEITGTVWDETPLELPVRTLRTTAVWLTLEPTLVDSALSRIQLGGGAHAAEHALVNLLPLFAPCDGWDVGGASAVAHPDTGQVTVFVHDAVVDGAGFAERAYDVADGWIRATWERLSACVCATGCPACVVSAACGSGNQVLDKATAALLLAMWMGTGAQ
jgi:DEAD/DEAH box helicase domain-containing protein